VKSVFPLHTKNRGSIGSGISIAVLIGCLFLAGWLVLNRQYVLDQITFWQYVPSKDIATISDKSQLTDHGKFFFYSSKPEVDDAAAFNNVCKKREEHSAILGCYAGGRIYIYNVSNEQLSGVKEVTASHEMLHAAWDRLSASEKERLSGLLNKLYDRIATGDLAERMAYYDRTQPGERANELHSILGTEVDNVGDELEQYYAQYFTDRKIITSLHSKYQAVFAQLEQRAKTLESQMAALESQITQQIDVYNAGVKQLNGDIEQFNSQAQAGTFPSQAAFNSRRAQLVVRSSELETMRSNVNTNISQYNALRDELITVNGQSDSLNKSIDSSLAPAPTI
jgi:chaperonin cofactor prefoldin